MLCFRLLKELPQQAQKLGFTENENADKSLFYLKKIRQPNKINL